MKPVTREKLIQLCIRLGVTDSYQYDIIFTEKRYVIVNKARGIGISTAFCLRALLRAVFPDIFGNKHREAVLVSRAEPQAQHLVEYVIDFWRKIEDQTNIKTRAISRSEISFDNGYKIFSIPCSPEAIRTYHGDVYLDEFAFFVHGEDKKMMTAISGVLSLGGNLMIVSTPCGQEGEFFRIWEDVTSRQYKRFKLPYSVCRRKIYLDGVKYERRRMFPLEFGQEYLCEFVSEESRAIPLELITQCVNQGLILDSHRKTENGLYMGVDFAKEVDETAISILEETPDNILKTFWLETFPTGKMDYSEQLKYIQALRNRLPSLRRINIDATGVGVKLLEDCQGMMGNIINGITFTTASKDRMFTNLKLGLLDRRIMIPRNEKLINQMHDIQKTINDNRTVGYRHPRGKHDDLFWSFCLALDGISSFVSSPAEFHTGLPYEVIDSGKVEDTSSAGGFGRADGQSFRVDKGGNGAIFP